MSFTKIGQDEWTQTGVKSTFVIRVPDNFQHGRTSYHSTICGLGWQFHCSIDPNSSHVFVDPNDFEGLLMHGGTGMTLTFDPHLLRAASYGQIFFSVETLSTRLFKIDSPFANNMTLPYHGSINLAQYVFPKSSHISPTFSITVTLPSNLGISWPRSLEPRLEKALSDTIGGGTSRARPMFAKAALLKGFSEDLDLFISGGNGFGEANVVDLDTYILEEDRIEGYGYMSDSDLDTDDEGDDDLRRSVRPCPPGLSTHDEGDDLRRSIGPCPLPDNDLGKDDEGDDLRPSISPYRTPLDSELGSPVEPVFSIAQAPPTWSPTLIESTSFILPNPQIQAPKPAAVHGMGRVLVIKDMSFRTWNALLHYLYTKKISFYNSSSPSQPRGELQCSPKSMYRLADKYGLEELKKMALESIRAQMSTKTIVEEVFSTFAFTYAEIQSMELEFLIAHLSEVRGHMDKALDICGVQPRCVNLVKKIIYRAI
ncbi:hypothetical protein C8J57DRAFT_1720347 [Mycena rebaudengoi]|nr:hypothetical protein C8J57DRAFT_1720347 [Mycena rebaudengoi]